MKGSGQVIGVSAEKREIERERRAGYFVGRARRLCASLVKSKGQTINKAGAVD